ncbi:MAG: cation:proton antiporter [Lewinella sp.]|uniref:cation:proton antiporter domain-containing protein n=1 Tax=Lewinella sp. TaxID=2004506 RepID=UPI003D6B1DF2
MQELSAYTLIIGASLILILSFFFGEAARKTSIPSVLMLIVLGILLQFVLDAAIGDRPNFLPVLKILGTVGLIMIVLEAALELELKPGKYLPIVKALFIALICLLVSAYVAALILHQFIPGMDMASAWLYATPLSILSSAIIIPSVTALREDKKEFHIYESTFSDILGIMMFYFLTGNLDAGGHGSGFLDFSGNLLLTIGIAVIASYLIILIFQNIRSHTKLFLLIAVLLLLYAVGKKMHLSSLIIILVFGLVIANMKVFFRGRLGQWLHLEKASQMYEGLHVVTMESAFVVRTFFFVIFGLTISLASITSLEVTLISMAIVASIYVIRYIFLRIFIGKDIFPQLYIAPRGLITILLFYDIPEAAIIPGFEPGILLDIIIGTSLIMTFAMIRDKQRTSKAIEKAKEEPVGYERWKAPTIAEYAKEEGDSDKH